MMYKKIAISAVLLSSLATYTAAKNIGLKPEKVQEQEKVEGFKNINRAPGLSEFDSTKYIAKLPSVENNLNCNTPEVKELVMTKLYTDKYDFVGGYKVLKKNANSTYCSFTYKNGENTDKEYFWVFQENGQIDVKKLSKKSLNCNDPKVLEYFKKIAAGRKITIEEFGGISDHYYSSDDETISELKCSLAYKTSDLEDVEQLNYKISRDDDYQITLVTQGSEDLL